MFSSLRASTRSLSARLLIGQLCLLLVVCLGIGAVTVLALHQYLIGEVDKQLRETAHRSAIIYGQPPPPPLPPTMRDNRPPWPARAWPGIPGRTWPTDRDGRCRHQ